MSYNIKYKFDFGDHRTQEFDLSLHSKTLSLATDPALESNYPDWTKLDEGKCSNCPLNSKEHPRCPIAINLSSLVEKFKGEVSTTKIKVTVETSERTFTKSTDVQDALFSIFGVIMATSGCPIMDFFKPMARFHLPFATIEEHLVRSTSFYLLRQYFHHQRGEETDLDLKKLNEKYHEVKQVNIGFLGRISKVAVKDADKNAVVILDAISELLTSEFDGKLEMIEYLFESS